MMFLFESDKGVIRIKHSVEISKSVNELYSSHRSCGSNQIPKFWKAILMYEIFFMKCKIIHEILF